MGEFEVMSITTILFMVFIVIPLGLILWGFSLYLIWWFWQETQDFGYYENVYGFGKEQQDER